MRHHRGHGGRLQQEVREIEALEARIAAGAPCSGSNPLATALVDANDAVSYAGAVRFEQLPISELTKCGLRDARYVEMTDIQRAALPHALCGRSILGASQTGSGKTLAFLIPVLERLYRLRWGNLDGVGALILAPTRELACQIYRVLEAVGKYHSLSKALIIGRGTRRWLDQEKASVNSMNILVSTPGRLLDHMHTTVHFDCSQLQVLVLDEADRILDPGFAGTVDLILSQLPTERQTFLFSATQKRVKKDLERLSLHDPEYLAVHEDADSPVATPRRLQQQAWIVPLDQKMDALWRFIKANSRKKIIVFLSTCKQVKFVHGAFSRLRPGIILRCLHGRLKQHRRNQVYEEFSAPGKPSVLFTTDIGARGLDFKAVDWVLQVDCPENPDTYQHRVGRTARFKSSGRALLFLMPQEQGMLELLRKASIPIKLEEAAAATKVPAVSARLAAVLSQDPQLKFFAQRAVVTYLRSLVLQRMAKEEIGKLPLEEYAASYGLPSAPRLRFITRKGGSTLLKNLPYALKDEERDAAGSVPAEDSDDDDSEDFLKKRSSRADEQAAPIEMKKKRLRIDADKVMGKRMVFDEQGNAAPPLSALAMETEAGGDREELASAVAARKKWLKQEMKKRDREDKAMDKERLRKKRRLRDVKQHAQVTEDDDDEEELSLADQEALAARLLSSQ